MRSNPSAVIEELSDEEATLASGEPRSTRCSSRYGSLNWRPPGSHYYDLIGAVSDFGTFLGSARQVASAEATPPHEEPRYCMQAVRVPAFGYAPRS